MHIFKNAADIQTVAECRSLAAALDDFAAQLGREGLSESPLAQRVGDQTMEVRDRLRVLERADALENTQLSFDLR